MAKNVKSAREQELESQMAEMRGRLDTMLQLMSSHKPVGTGKALVGIRNVSSYTIGLMNRIHGEEGELQLHPEAFGTRNPNARAVVSEQFWQYLKREREVRNGLIVRDDSFITSGNVAPADLPEDTLPETVANLIIDPFDWIDSKTDDEIRSAIFKITAEQTLRRLFAAVDHKIWEIGEQRYKGDSERGKKAVRDLPAKYRYVEQLVLERLDEFRPNHDNYANERETRARL